MKTSSTLVATGIAVVIAAATLVFLSTNRRRDNPGPVKEEPAPVSSAIDPPAAPPVPDPCDGAVEIGFGSPLAIDGKKTGGEWDSAHQMSIPIVLPDTSRGSAKLFLMNDRTHLHVAFEFGVTRKEVRQTFSYSLASKEARSLFEDGTDFALLNPGIYICYDGVRSSKPPCPPGEQWAGEDEDWGGSNDVVGGFGITDSGSFYEFSKPLRTTDVENDVQLQPGHCYCFGIDLRLIDPELSRGKQYPAGYGDTRYPDGGKLLVRIALPR